MIEFEWDEDKRASNLAKHGIDFKIARVLFFGRPTVTVGMAGFDEERNRTTGIIIGKFWTVIWAYRSGAIRFISVRRARGAEIREYRSLYR